MSAENPYAPPRTNVDVDAGEADIDSLPVSDTWKRRFKAMHKAGGPNLPHYKNLAPEDRKSLSMFNILAFLFGPIYYLFKGMWRKAIVLLVLSVIVLTILDMLMELVGLGKYTRATGFAAAAVYAALANGDYYRKMVLGRNGWWWP